MDKITDIRCISDQSECYFNMQKFPIKQTILPFHFLKDKMKPSFSLGRLPFFAAVFFNCQLGGPCMSWMVVFLEIQVCIVLMVFGLVTDIHLRWFSHNLTGGQLSASSEVNLFFKLILHGFEGKTS